MSNDEFAAAVCRRNTFECNIVPTLSVALAGDCDSSAWWSRLANLFRSIGIEPVVEPVRLFDADPDLDDRRRPDILIRNPRGFDRQVILDVAVTGVDMFVRVAYDDTYKPLEDRCKQKINKCLRVANQSGLQLIPAVFSHKGQMHGEVKRFIKDQTRLQLTYIHRGGAQIF